MYTDLDPSGVYVRENDTKSFYYVDTRTTSAHTWDLVLQSDDGERDTVRLFEREPERYVSVSAVKDFYLRVEI